MRAVLFLSMIALATGLYSCCAYRLENGDCDAELCPGECIFTGDECIDRVDVGCYLQSVLPLDGEDCLTCACDPNGPRSVAKPSDNKYGSLKISPAVLPPCKGKKGKKCKKQDL